jgi:hypothetical protein
VLILRDGTLVTGTVIETTADAITIELEAGGRSTFSVELIAPRSFLEHRGAALGDDQVDELLALLDFAALEGLFRQAGELLSRLEGQADRQPPEFMEALTRRRQALREAEASALVAQARQQQREGNLERALELTKQVLERFPDTGAQAAAVALSDRLLAARRQQLADEAAAQAEELAAAGDEDRQRAMRRGQRVWDEAARAKAAGEEAAARCAEHATTSGNRSRMRKGLASTEQHYGKAVRYLRQMPDVLAGVDGAEADQLRQRATAGITFLEDAMVTLYCRVARIYVDERNYRGADELVRKGMSLRPNHATLRELDETIAEKWKKRSAAQRSNARPIIRGW